MKKVFVYYLFLTVFLSNSYAGSLTIQGKFPFDTIAKIDYRDYGNGVIKIDRYNLLLFFNMAITAICPPTPFYGDIYEYAPMNYTQYSEIKSLNHDLYTNLFSGVICRECMGFPTKECVPSVKINTAGYRYIFGIKAPNDTLFIHATEAYFDSSKTPLVSIHFKFDYKPGTTTAISAAFPHKPVSQKDCRLSETFTIRGTKVAAQSRLTSGVYLIRSGQRVLVQPGR